LSATPSGRRQSLIAAEKVLPLEIAAYSKLMKPGSSREEWLPYLADAQVNYGSVQVLLRRRGDSAELVKKGLASWKELIKKDQSSSAILDDAAQDFLFAEPASLKDPQLAVTGAERAVTLSNRKLPPKLLTLAQAYRAACQVEKSRAAAKEGLALLPTPQQGSMKPRIRKLLDILAQSRS
jgi:hypothetical protein